MVEHRGLALPRWFLTADSLLGILFSKPLLLLTIEECPKGTFIPSVHMCKANHRNHYPVVAPLSPLHCLDGFEMAEVG